MPPKAKISRDMIVDAAFTIAREAGAESINARSVAQKLGCSTQPVMHHFPRVEELRRAAFEATDAFHTSFLMQPVSGMESITETIGLNYIRFAVEETNLFRFLFQSGFALESSLPQLLDAPHLAPVLDAMQAEMQLSPEQLREVFLTLAFCVHGYASIVANSAMEYDESAAAGLLEQVYRGAMLALKEEAEYV